MKTTFADFGLAPPLLKAIQELGFEHPTPVQSQVIPKLLQGARDLVALAQTGTGKTAAFGLPLLQLTDPARATTQALILCPTRELCLQITSDFADFGRHAPAIRTVAVYGGASIDTQMRALRRGAQIIVATPGRMQDLLRRKAVRLADVQRVVLDEADEMLNMGFQEDLEAILKEVPGGARTLLFSATMPRQVAAIASQYMHVPEEILVGQRNAGAEQVSHECYVVHARDRYPALRRIIDYYQGLYGIVFCRTRLETQEIADRLKADGYPADALHGELSQPQRDRVMKNFRDRELHILVATDVAARGLDVTDLTHVINYNLPDVANHYTHRSGRTGRAGKTGISIALVHLHETSRLRIIEQLTKKPFVRKPVPTGRAVCEAQLLSLLERIRQLDVTDRQLDLYLPTINRLLGDLPREDLVQRLIRMEFGRFLKDYQNAPDLNVQEHRPTHGGKAAHGRPLRSGQAPEAPTPADGDVVRLQINFGHRHGLTPAGLISLINRVTRGPKLRLGRIKVMESVSVFEMFPRDAQVLVPELNEYEVDGRDVRVVTVDNFAHQDAEVRHPRHTHDSARRPHGHERKPHPAAPRRA